MEISEKAMGGGWSNGYIMFAYVNEAELYYAGARIGRNNWSIEKSALAGGEQNFGEVADPRIVAGGVVIPRYQVVIEGNDVVIYADRDGEWEEQNRHTFGAGMPIGRVGLVTENATTQFDDFVMSGPEVKGLVAVEPADKLAATWGKLKARL